VLQAIYSRHHLHDDEFVELVCPMFTPGSVTLLREVYDWTLSDMDVHDLNEQKYTLCKKLSEVILHLFFAPCPLLIPTAGQ
jgi:exportin-5